MAKERKFSYLTRLTVQSNFSIVCFVNQRRSTLDKELEVPSELVSSLKKSMRNWRSGVVIAARFRFGKIKREVNIIPDFPIPKNKGFWRAVIPVMKRWLIFFLQELHTNKFALLFEEFAVK